MSLHKLENLFTRFPGIGPRQAKRFVYFLLTRDDSFIDDLSSSISDLKNNIRACNACHKYFPTSREGHLLCAICQDPERDSTSLLLIEKDVDLENIEKSNIYKGKYFILGGTIPVLEKEPAKRIRSTKLLNEIVRRSEKEGLKEIVIAMNLNPEGENTLDYIIKMIEPLKEKYKLKISVLGRGLSTGTEIEYSDTETIKNAFRNRF